MDLTQARWRKSTRSGNNGGACVEVADNLPGVVLVRDTKDRAGGTLVFTPASWRGFVNLAKAVGPIGRVQQRMIQRLQQLRERDAERQVDEVRWWIDQARGA